MWYQSGLVGAPPFDAMTTTLSPSVVYTIGVVRFLPDLAPVVVSSTSGAPANMPVTWPPLARNSSIERLVERGEVVVEVLEVRHTAGGNVDRVAQIPEGVDLTDLDLFAGGFPHDVFTRLRADRARAVARADRAHARRRRLLVGARRTPRA